MADPPKKKKLSGAQNRKRRAEALAAAKAGIRTQAHAAGVPWRTIMIEVMGFNPDHVDRMQVERDDDLLFAEQLAQLRATAAGAQLERTSPLAASGAPSAGGGAGSGS